MEIRGDFLTRALEEAAIEQTAKDYAQNGYTIRREVKLGRFIADLVAKKGRKIIVFEFKSGRWNERKAHTVARLRNYVIRETGGEFKLVLVNIPQEKEIFIDGIEDILCEILHNDMSQVDELATHVYLDEIADVDIDVVNIDNERINVIGSGTVTYELQYGSDADMRNEDGLESTESFPFTFHVYLKHNLTVDEVEEIDIDKSSFYE